MITSCAHTSPRSSRPPPHLSTSPPAQLLPEKSVDVHVGDVIFDPSGVCSELWSCIGRWASDVGQLSAYEFEAYLKSRDANTNNNSKNKHNSDANGSGHSNPNGSLNATDGSNGLEVTEHSRYVPMSSASTLN